MSGGASFSSLATGSYSGIVIDDNGCLSNSVGFTISAPGAPAPPVGSPDDTLCDGDIIPDLTATGSNIEWFSDSLLSNLLGTGSPFPISPSVGVTIYYVTQTVGSCQSAADTVIITINTTPGPPTTGIDTSYCVGDVISDITATGTNIKWYSDSALTTMIGTGSPFAITPGLGTTVYYATDSINGCTGPADSVVITVNAIPATPVAGTDATYCSGATIADLTSTGTNPLWYSDAALTLSIGSGSTLTITPPIGTTTYYVIDSVAGCVGAADSVVITVNVSPGAPVAGGDSTYCFGDTVADLTATGTGLEWFSDAGLTASLGTGSTLSISPGVGTTTYQVTATEFGCQSTASQVTITVDPCSAQNDTAVFVPNIFKPSSGNPDNEKLYVFGSLIESYTLMIFERWGPKVYETSDATQTSLNDGITCCKYGEGWDGNYQSSDKKLNTAVSAGDGV